MSGDGFGRMRYGSPRPTVEGGYVEEVLEWERAPDQKYIVFKREDLPNYILSPRLRKEMELVAIYDAVVIRTQDSFAGPALHTYAASISTAAKLLKELDAETAIRLQNIADYFHYRAIEADSEEGKLPG